MALVLILYVPRTGSHPEVVLRGGGGGSLSLIPGLICRSKNSSFPGASIQSLARNPSSVVLEVESLLFLLCYRTNPRRAGICHPFMPPILS